MAELTDAVHESVGLCGARNLPEYSEKKEGAGSEGLGAADTEKDTYRVSAGECYFQFNLN